MNNKLCRSEHISRAAYFLTIVLLLAGNARGQQCKPPTVILTFDDASVTHYRTVAPLLRQYGFGATFFVCDYPRKPEQESKNMSWQQIAALNAMGFEIGNHTGHHRGVSKLSPAELRAEIRYIELRCAENGIPKPISFGYPGNRSDSAARVVLREMGYRMARVGGSRYYDPQKDDCMLIPSYSMTDSLDAKTMKALENLRHGEVLVFTIHEVPDPEHAAYSTSVERIEKYLRYMQAHHFHVIALRDLPITLSGK